MTRGVIITVPTLKSEGKGWTVVRPAKRKGERLLESRVDRVMSDAKKAIDKLRNG